MEVLVAGKWLSVPVTDHTRDTVTIGPVPARATRLRYNWYSNPCGIGVFGCAVYAKVTPLGKLSGEEDVGQLRLRVVLRRVRERAVVD